MKNSRPLARFRAWLEQEEVEKAELPPDPERAEFVEYLEYLETQHYIDFSEYRQMRALERGEPPPTVTHYQDAQETADHEEKKELTKGHLILQFRIYLLAAACIAGVMIWALTLVVLALPSFGDPQAPAVNEVARRYLERGVEETGAINTIAGMILDYRAFDTFGEATVLFSATVGIGLLQKRKRWNREREANDLLVLRTGRLLIPVIFLFGIYVVLNGHLSPGGGFSGGAILGAGLILCAMVLGEERMETLLSARRISCITSVCLMTYAAMKGYSFFTGANHVGWIVPKGVPGAMLSGGFILPLNLCVGTVVACTIYTFYTIFSAEGEEH